MAGHLREGDQWTGSAPQHTTNGQSGHGDRAVPLPPAALTIPGAIPGGPDSPFSEAEWAFLQRHWGMMHSHRKMAVIRAVFEGRTKHAAEAARLGMSADTFADHWKEFRQRHGITDAFDLVHRTYAVVMERRKFSATESAAQAST